MRAACIGGAVMASSCSLLTSLTDLSATDASPTTFTCANDAAFCDDFEADGSFFPRWTGSTIKGSGVLARAVVDSGCIAASVGNGATSSAATLSKAFLENASVAHYAFDLRVVSFPTTGTANICELELPPSDSGVVMGGHLFITLGSESAKLAEQHHYPDGGYSMSQLLPFAPPPVGVWTHYDLVIDLVGSTMSIAVDGTTVGSTPTSIAAVYGPGQITINAGVTYASPICDQASIDLDNVVVWLQ
jgi:hypothetical protein